MQTMNLQARRPKRFRRTTQADASHTSATNSLDRRFDWVMPNCWDNTVVESTSAIIKAEAFDDAIPVYVHEVLLVQLYPPDMDGIEDPEFVRWRRKYPKFPGVVVCVHLLGRGNVRAGMIDIICAELEANASTIGDQLMDSFRTETSLPVRRILMSVMSRAKMDKFAPVFYEQLHSTDESLRIHAKEALQALGLQRRQF